MATRIAVQDTSSEINQITIPETENCEYDDHPSFVIELITDQSEIDIRKFTLDNDDL